jgi:TnpA family transposase
MPRRSPLTASERTFLLAFPADEAALIRHYTLSEGDLSVIRQHRGGANRIGFAVQLCALRYPGFALPPDGAFPEPLLTFVARQLHLDPALGSQYGQRSETRREHLLELQAWLGLISFGASHFRDSVEHLTELAQQTDRGIVLATALIERLRQQRIIVPVLEVIERVCAEALARGTRRVYESLTAPLSDDHRSKLEGLLVARNGSSMSALAWLRQPPGAPNAKHVLIHLERLRALLDLALPEELGSAVHPNRLSKLAREGERMTAQHLRDLETTRRYATLTAIVLDTRATLIDEILDLHDRILGLRFSSAKRQHSDQFQRSGKAINQKLRLYSRIGRALVQAKQSGSDPFAAIEAIVSWEAFTESVTEAEKLSQPEDFDYLPHLGDGFTQLRRYTPTLLETLTLKAAPAAKDLLEGVETLRAMNLRQARKVPEDAPTRFIRKRWESVVHTADGLDRRFYELCVLSELRNALRSGDIWVQGSRQFKDFDGYLLPPSQFAGRRERQGLGLAVETDCERYLEERMAVLEGELGKVERLAARNELPDAAITAQGLKVTPLANAAPEEADALMRQVSALLPHLKITELLLEVDGWIDFTGSFTHLKSGEAASDKSLLLTAILADAINLGITKMAESCPGVTPAKLSWLQSWHLREETYSAALAEIVNAQSHHPFAAGWGAGNTSSSDGQRFQMGRHGKAAGEVNLKYGTEPGAVFYTHLSDQYAPFHIQVIHATARDATYVLDGLLDHEADLQIEEHYTDTAGFTDHVFALMHLLGFRFAPRIRDLPDKRLYICGEAQHFPTLAGLIGGAVNLKQIRSHWDDLLRLAASIRQGTVMASLMLRKLGSYPRQNGLAVALRELGRMERTLFTLDWLQSVELRRRVQVGLNKGEAKNALARAVFFNRLGELRDRGFETQRSRASGLNLVVAAIVLWNTVYLERAVQALRDCGQDVDEKLLSHLSPLGWEHINLTGDYHWRQSKHLKPGQFRPLRPFTAP